MRANERSTNMKQTKKNWMVCLSVCLRPVPVPLSSSSRHLPFISSSSLSSPHPSSSHLSSPLLTVISFLLLHSPLLPFISFLLFLHLYSSPPPPPFPSLSPSFLSLSLPMLIRCITRGRAGERHTNRSESVWTECSCWIRALSSDPA